MKTVSTGKELGAALREVAVIAEDDFIIILKKLAMDAMRSLITLTAVDTGYARSKWQVTVDKAPSEGPHSGVKPAGHKKGTELYAQPQIAPISGIKTGSVIVFYNNTKYIVHLEMGTPRMKSQPMVEPTYQMLLSVANKLVTELTKRQYNV